MSPGDVEYAMFCVACRCMVSHHAHRCPNCSGSSLTTDPPTQRDTQLSRIETKLDCLLEAQMTTQADVDAITTQLTKVSDDIGAARATLQAEIDKLAAAQPATDLSGLQAAANKLDPAVVALGQITPTPATTGTAAGGPATGTTAGTQTVPGGPGVPTTGTTAGTGDTAPQAPPPPGTVIGGAVIAPGTVVGGAGATPAEAGTPAPAVDPANPPPIPLPGQ